MLVTEWGYGPTGVRAADYFAYQEDLQDEFGASAIFWLWKERSQGGWGLFDYDEATGAWAERATMRAQLARVMPEAIAGWPTSWIYDRAMRRFELRYAGDAMVTAPTRIYVPAPEDFVAAFDVTFRAERASLLTALRTPYESRPRGTLLTPRSYTVRIASAQNGRRCSKQPFVHRTSRVRVQRPTRSPDNATLRLRT